MKSYTITDKCIGCTLCAKQCPVKAIDGEIKQKHIIDEEKCIRCGLCGKVCPQNAVKDENGILLEKQPKKDTPFRKIDSFLHCKPQKFMIWYKSNHISKSK